MATHGLYLGKFAPLHKGHQSVIETARKEVDSLTALIYDAPETTNIPLDVRAGWIEHLYPDVKVIKAWDGPAQTGYTPEIMKMQEDYVLSLLGDERFTHFYSSEPYGEHMSKALGAIDRRVDEKREVIPMSATKIRKDTFRNKEFLDPYVYKDLVTHVVLMGAPSSGKTTLARRLAQEYNTQWMPEYGREYWEQHQKERRLTQEQLVEIGKGHREREDALLRKANTYLFTDTNAITTLLFAQYYHQKALPELREMADACKERYDVVFVCDIDIPYEDTWDRSGEVNRKVFHKQTLSYLKTHKIPFVLLSGTIDERVRKVQETLSAFKKYG
jgi:HTH-type transcriptional regulator, transcriptional repressor of NAD biosynthesis genes